MQNRTEDGRFQAAIQRFDEENAKDPNQELLGGTPQPRELVYAKRLTDWVLRLKPAASEALRLAARCQHIRRWEIPRTSYPATRDGYLRWRLALKHRHAEIAGEILRDVGYPEPLIRRVQALNLKEGLKQDEDCQTLEDALCLMFLEHQFAALADKTDDDKVIRALRKSWAKMSAQGREAAQGLRYGERERRLLEAALH